MRVPPCRSMPSLGVLEPGVKNTNPYRTATMPMKVRISRQGLNCPAGVATSRQSLRNAAQGSRPTSRWDVGVANRSHATRGDRHAPHMMMPRPSVGPGQSLSLVEILGLAIRHAVVRRVDVLGIDHVVVIDVIGIDREAVLGRTRNDDL